MTHSTAVFSAREQNLILVTMMIGTFMAALDGSIVNISLPAMAQQFGAALTQIEWVMLSYMIAFAVSIPLTGWLKDTLGFRWLYVGSLVIFTLGSLLCGYSTSLSALVWGRVIQALGGGALSPTAMAILSTVYPANKRGKAIGIWGLGVVVGPAIGPTLGGILTQHFGWPSIFLINIPVGIMGVILALRVLNRPLLEVRIKKAFHFVGFITLTIFLLSLLIGVTSLESGNKNFVGLLGLWTLALASLMIFIISSLKSKTPLVDLKIFLNQQFVVCILVTVARSIALYGGLFLLPFLMQSLLKFSETKSGLLMLPGSLLVGVLMPLSGKWADAHGPRSITILGILILSISMLIFSWVPLSATLLMLLAAMSLRGIGLGFLVTPVSTATVNSVYVHQVTAASSVSSLLQQCGGALGVSVFALLHQTAYERALMTGASEHAEAFALRLSFMSVSVAILISLLPALYLPRVMSGHQREAHIVE